MVPWERLDGRGHRFLRSRSRTFQTGLGYVVIEVQARSVSPLARGRATPPMPRWRPVRRWCSLRHSQVGQGRSRDDPHAQEHKGLRCQGCTQTVNQMKALVLTAPAELREMLDDLTTSALAKRCRNFRTSRLDDAKYALRSLAATVSSVMKCGTWRLRLNDSRCQSPRPWSKPSVWDPTRLTDCRGE